MKLKWSTSRMANGSNILLLTTVVAILQLVTSKMLFLSSVALLT